VLIYSQTYKPSSLFFTTLPLYIELAGSPCQLFLSFSGRAGRGWLDKDGKWCGRE